MSSTFLHSGTESQQSYGNGLFQYTAPDPLQGVGVAGEIGDYPAGGFFMQMSSNSTKALAKLANYKANNFIDIQTRAVRSFFATSSSLHCKYF